MSTLVGRTAEIATASYLLDKGYKIIHKNWRTRWCEIDIVAQKSDIIYFVEVKYRVSDRQGSGLDYITPRKLAQMRLAAEFWQAMHDDMAGYRLCAVELTGDPPQVTAFIDDI